MINNTINNGSIAHSHMNHSECIADSLSHVKISKWPLYTWEGGRKFDARW